MKISKLGVDKTEWTKSGKTLDFWDCHVFGKNGIFGIFSFCDKIQAFFQPKLSQKKSRGGVEKSAPRVLKGLLKMICDGLINTYSGIRHKCIPHTLRDAWCLSACEKPHIRTRIFDCVPHIPYSPLFVSCNISLVLPYLCVLCGGSRPRWLVKISSYP